MRVEGWRLCAKGAQEGVVCEGWRDIVARVSKSRPAFPLAYAKSLVAVVVDSSTAGRQHQVDRSVADDSLDLAAMAKFATPEDEWRAFLDGSHPSITWGRRTFRHIPSGPRCRVCYAPFGEPGGALFRRLGFVRWEKNPNVCVRCLKDMRMYDVLGAEVEISFLFADVRHSSEIARQMGTMEFTHLMQRFYATANQVLIDNDALIDKFVGDEVVGFFMPFLAGKHHAGAAVRAAQALLLATGHGEGDEPWLPLGAGVHTGITFVGMVSSGHTSEFTALGDPINIAAHVVAHAAPGEILVTDAAATAAGLQADLERRHLSLKGAQADVVVVPVGSDAMGAGGSANR